MPSTAAFTPPALRRRSETLSAPLRVAPGLLYPLYEVARALHVDGYLLKYPRPDTLALLVRIATKTRGT